MSKAGLDAYAAAYLDGSDPTQPLASPARGDLGGLPPLLIQTGGDEVLLSDSHALAAAASARGVEVRLEVTPQMPHVFHFFHPMLTDARRALAEAGAWIRAHTGG